MRHSNAQYTVKSASSCPHDFDKKMNPNAKLQTSVWHNMIYLSDLLFLSSSTYQYSYYWTEGLPT